MKSNIINYGSQIDSITNTKIDFNASLAHLDTELGNKNQMGNKFLMWITTFPCNNAVKLQASILFLVIME